jgi:SAM-dependent methyltransferase
VPKWRNPRLNVLRVGDTVAEPWNHNVHYHRLLLERMPVPCEEALDVGCGDGILAVKLAARARHVTAIDRSREMITKARQRVGKLRNVTLLEDDLLADTLPKNRFDFIVAVAVVHHMAFDRAVGQMVQLLRPGGTLAILGLARNGAPGAWGPSPKDYLWIPPALLFNWFQRIRLGSWDPGAPIVEPEMTYAEITKQASARLPGAELTRRLLFRYTLFWRKPG